VVNGPIDNEDASDVWSLYLELPCGDGDAVKVAEAHRLLVLGVVAGRTDQGKAVADLAPRNLQKKTVQCCSRPMDETIH
jgi:hypothetical protein